MPRSKKNKKGKQPGEKIEIYGTLDRKKRIKLLIILPIIVLAGISVFVFMSSRGDSRDDISVELTTHVLNSEDNTSQKPNQLIAGRETLLTYRITDNKRGKPISGLRPDINFFSPQTGESVIEHKHSFGDYYTTGEISLAKLQLFVLNSERGTIEVLDTFGGYDPRPLPIKRLGTMTSKVIRLKDTQKAADILAGRYGDNVYATLPGENKVAVVNTISHEVIKYIDVDKMPGRMFLQPGSKYLWVSNDGSGSMSLIDTDNVTLARTIKTGKGYHQVAFSPGKAYVTNSENGTVTVIGLDTMEKEKDIEVGIGPYGIDYSKAGDQAFVANIMQGTVSIIDARTDKIEGNIPLENGVEGVRFSPDGTLVIVLNQHLNKAHIIDAINKTIIRTAETGEAPTGIDFMEEYAIIRNTYSPDVTYISMKDTGVSNIAPIGIEPPLVWTPHSIMTTSNGDEVVVTSPREGRIYFMHKMNGEPMAMSSTRVEFGSDAVAIVENRLHETAPGTYQQYIILDREGPFDIKFRSEQINATFKIEVLPDLTIGFQAIALFNSTLETGKTSMLRYQIIDRKSGKPEENLTDLIFLIIKPGKGGFTKRAGSVYLGNGTYEAGITFQEEGEYMITLNSNMLKSKGYEEAYDYFTVRNR